MLALLNFHPRRPPARVFFSFTLSMPMSTPKTTVSLAILAALGLGAAFSFGRTQAVPAVTAPTAVAVVDVRQAMRAIKEADAIQADLKAKGTAADADLTKRKEVLKGIQDKIKIMQPGS